LIREKHRCGVMDSGQLNAVVRIREITLNRERGRCAAAQAELERRQVIFRLAVEEMTNLRRQYETELIDIAEKFRTGRLTASTMVGAINATERTAGRAQSAELDKKKREEEVSEAEALLRKARERVQRAAHKIESLNEIIRRSRTLENQAVELRAEQDLDEQAVLRSSVL
jgi:hypothetical protein